MNVLLVVFDTARADALEPYGAPAGASPAVSQLAARGRALPRVSSTSCWTLPVHASMFSGLLPRALGLTQAPNGSALGARPVIEASRDRWLPEVFRRAGWRTQAVSCNGWISPAAGWDVGFDDFVAVDSGRHARLDRSGWRERASWAVEAARGHVDDGAAEAGRVLRGWIEAADEQPRFWFVNLLECHSPYLPPRPYGRLGPLSRARAAGEARHHLTLEGITRACLGDFDVPDGAIERMRALYAEAVRYLDEWLAGVLEALDQRGILDETLVILLSDHGENLGEGGLLAHAWSLDERLCRVPVVCAGPGAHDGDLSSLGELPAFLAGAAGIAHPWHEALPPLAVAQFDPPGDGPDDPRIVAAAERLGLDEEATRRMTEPLTSVTDGTRKLVRRGGREELYDLAADPLEERPIQPAGDGVAALRAALEHPAALAVAGPVAPPAAPAADEDEVARLEQQMRMLGYM